MKISKRDWVHLSSYLDGELNPKIAKQLESRIDRDPELQHALDELRSAKKILRATPRLKVPRNFILSPEMVGIKRRSRPVRGYRLASVLMSMMLIGVLVLDFGRSLMGGAMAPAAPKEVMLEALPESGLDAMEEPALMEAEAELEDRAVSETDLESPAEEVVQAPEVSAEAMEEGESVGAVGEAETKSAGDEDSETSANMVDEVQEEVAEESMAEPTPTLWTDISETPVPQVTDPAYFQDDEVQREIEVQPIDPYRVLEVIFGLGAVGFGIGAWLVRRKNR